MRARTFFVRFGIGLLTALMLQGWHAAAAADDTLLDVLRQKQVLTPQEYERLKGTELTPPQRAGLIDILRDKGILTKDEAAKLEPGAPSTTAAAPAVPAVAPAAEKPAAPPQIGYDEGFFIRSHDGNFSIRFNGRVSSNFLFFEPGTTQTDTETIDRGRLSVDATVYKYFRMRLENDFAFSSGLRDAFIALTPLPEFNIQIGQFKIPFSYEELLSKRYTDFVERAAVVNSTVNPSRDVGVMLYGQFANRIVQYQLAGMNGAGQNRSDNNSDKDIIARLVLAPFSSDSPEQLRGFNVGGAMTYGREPSGTTTQRDGFPTFSPGSIAGTTETGFTFFQLPSVTSFDANGTPLQPVIRQGDRLRTGTHAAWLAGSYSLTSEYIHTEETRFDGSGYQISDLDTDGAYVGGTWMLSGETKPFNARVRPTRPLWDLTRSGGWGAWETALRYEFFKLRHPGFTGNRYDAIIAGLNWYPNEFLRFSVNYLYGTFDNQGKGESPNPTKRSNNAVLGRAQLEF